MCGLRLVLVMISSTAIPRATSASPISDRWQRRPGTASARMIHLALLFMLMWLAQALVELRRLHVIRVAAKTRVFPARIDRILPRMPQAAESGQMHIPDPMPRKFLRQRLAVELGIMRDLGMVRTSASCSTPFAANISRKVSIGCVECPMVRITAATLLSLGPPQPRSTPGPALKRMRLVTILESSPIRRSGCAVCIFVRVRSEMDAVR